MIKKVIVLVLGVMLFQTAKAQKQNALLYYISYSNGVVSSRDSADYYIVIMPQDQYINKKMYPVKEYYLTDTLKMTGYSKVKSYPYKLDGECLDYFSNNHKKDILNYSNGSPMGNAIEYYNNGNIYVTGLYNSDKKLHINKCLDSTGSVLAENGSGKLMKFDDTRKAIIAQGPIADGLENGEWYGTINDTGKYTCLYNKGIIMSGTAYDKSGTAYPFKTIEDEPSYKGGLSAFKRFVQSKMIFPEAIKNHSTMGARYEYDIIIKFEIEQDGSVTNMGFIKPPVDLLKDAVINAVNSSPKWKPASTYGIPLKKEVTIEMTLVDSNTSQ